MFIASVVKGKSGRRSMLIQVDDLFPECKNLTKDTKLPRLSCWVDPGSCHVGTFNICMGMVVERAYRIFSGMPDLDLIILHWDAKYKSSPGGIRKWGLIIEHDENKELRISTLNKWACHQLSNNVGKKYSIDMEL